ncbi:MAG: metallophosphoesterase [Bryobacteraceae bacterium]
MPKGLTTPPPGPKGQLYAEPQASPDEKTFRVDNTSSDYYNSPYYTAHKDQIQRIPPRRNNLPLSLTDFAPQKVADAIQAARKISFHAVGDTGAAKVNRTQTVASAIGHETAVATAMAKDTADPSGPAFFFHLGDIIYNFGEAQYYYDQFYEPFRAYNRPIFAIPGNHDGMVFGQGSSGPQVPTLDAFLANFCAAVPGMSPDAGGLIRSVMTQPGVYFTLDAPYVSIIGLYSNVLNGPGVISSQGGHFPITDDQLDFLKSELTRLKPDRVAQKRAVLLAVHHPPLSADAKHGGSLGIQKDIDACCKAAGLCPDAVLSGHAHLYQRFTRTVAAAGGKETPYIVAGSGGFAATAPKGKYATAGTKDGDHVLEIAPIIDFGYLTVETDAKTLSFVFKTADQNGVAIRDSVTVDLKAGKLLNATGPTSGAAATPAPATKKKRAPRKKK